MKIFCYYLYINIQLNNNNVVKSYVSTIRFNIMNPEILIL